MADPHVFLVAALLTSKGALKARVGVGGGQPGRSGNGPVDRQTDWGIVGLLGLGSVRLAPVRSAPDRSASFRLAPDWAIFSKASAFVKVAIGVADGAELQLII